MILKLINPELPGWSKTYRLSSYESLRRNDYIAPALRKGWNLYKKDDTTLGSNMTLLMLEKDGIVFIRGYIQYEDRELRLPLSDLQEQTTNV